MKLIETAYIETVLDYPKLIEGLRTIFQSNFTMPVRHHHFYKNREGDENTMILMPSWNEKYMGIKQVVVAARNQEKQLPAIHALYSLLDAVTGLPLAQMDAAGLTSRRTACTSALAASFLARAGAKELLVIGSGKVAEHLVQAHTSVRAYTKISLWARNPEKAKALVEDLLMKGYPVAHVADLETAVRSADVISSATLAQTAFIKGDWIKPGTHIDLIGSHTPRTREADDDTILKSRIYVDSREGALHETGELAIPIAQGILHPSTIQGDIVELCKGLATGRQSEQEITLFKSAGLAVEDLAAAVLVYESTL